jgi:hypothetical protein
MAEDNILNNDPGDPHILEVNTEGENNLTMQLSLDDQTNKSMSDTFSMTEGSMNKRNREEEQNGFWIDVKKRPKRRIIPNKNATTDQVEQFTEICVTCKSTLPKRFALSKLLRDHDVTNVVKVKYINPYKVHLHFDSEPSAERFLSNPVFADKYGWRSLRTYEVGLSYGIVRDIDLGLQENEVMENMTSDVEIVTLKRLNKRNTEESGWVESEVMRICFKGATLPPYIYLFEVRTKIEPYIFPVSQCSKCWRFGHTQKLCPKRITCPKCTGNHANCETTTYKCRNCAGNHMALDKSCPMYQKEKSIRDIMSESNVTYKKAAEMYIPPKSPIVSIPPRIDIHSHVPSFPTSTLKNTSSTQELPGKKDKPTYS